MVHSGVAARSRRERRAATTTLAAMRLPGLRSRLLVLAFGSMVPVLALCLLLAWILLERETALMRDGAFTRNRAVASAVDAKLDGHLAALRALGTLQSLERGDLQDFKDAATRAQAAQPHWRNVLLVDESGRQLLNLRMPLGAALPMEDDSELPSLRDVLSSGQARVGNLGRRPVSGVFGIPMQIRVEVAGQALALKLIIDPQAFTVLMTSQELPGTWVAAIVDGNGRFIARNPARSPGEPASSGLRAAMRESRSGWMSIRTLEGMDAQQAFVGSALSPWTIAVAIPKDEVLAGARRAALWLALGTVLSMMVAGGLALALARRVARPIHTLARAAHDVGNGNGDVTPLLDDVAQRPGFAEALELTRALQHAVQSIREREALRERERVALREADQAKNEFLAMLGHELRNPLSAITTSAQVLRISKPGAETGVRAHQVIERQARQMSRLVEDLMDISRLATGKLRLELELLDLCAAVERAIETWRQANTLHDVRVALNCGPTWVRIDRARVEQILVNLLENAAKFSPKGGAIDVEVRSQGEHAVLEVRDQGQGIAPEDLAQIFETFYQAAQSLHRPQGGLGLGLALVKRLAELHGGRVQAHSDGAGRGTTLTVALPLAVAPAQRDAAADPPRATPGRRVLLVEDNDDGRLALEMMLRLEGHDVEAVATGEAALGAVQRRPPEVAIIDVGLPDIDGWEVARRMSRMALVPRPLLVAITGFGQHEDKERSRQAGFDLHLTKPVDPAALSEVLSGASAQGSAAA
jgi:signal transduction histidine kinase/ActR/RegA family two-component response regulator